MKDLNKKTVQDGLYMLAKVGLGSIPILGSAASELFGMIVTPPLEERRQRWMGQIAERLQQLESESKIDFNDLVQNEQFIDVILQASSVAIKTSADEKLLALRNAVINTALDDCPSTTKSHMFLNLIDSFTVWHIKIITLYNDPKDWFENHGESPPNLMMGGLSSILKAAYPEIFKEKDLVNVIWKDLYDAGLHNSSELSTMVSGDAMLAPRTTLLGKEFLGFIKDSGDRKAEGHSAY